MHSTSAETAQQQSWQKTVKKRRKNRTETYTHTHTHWEKRRKNRYVLLLQHENFVAFGVLPLTHTSTQTQDEESRNLRAALFEKISCLHTHTHIGTHESFLVEFYWYFHSISCLWQPFSVIIILVSLVLAVFCTRKKCVCWGCMYVVRTASAEISSLFITHTKDD